MRYNFRVISWRAYYKLINPFQFAYWRIFQPRWRGVKCIVQHEGKVLLVRLCYAHKMWSVPGGRLERDESYETGAQRELKEETNLDIFDLKKFGEYEARPHGRRDLVYCFSAQVVDPSTLKIDPVELSDAGWFSPDQLPEPYTPNVPKILAMLKN